MSETALQVYDKPMCCSTGVCGPDVDDTLVRFAADLEWLASQGVPVVRFNPAQEPFAFVKNRVVRRALQERGNECLPLLLLGDAIVASGGYPDRDALVLLTGLTPAGGGA